MGFRSNQPTTGRDFYFSTSGNNLLIGTSDENPLADPVQAITNVNALIPVPGSSDPASINATVTGTYTVNLILPDSTSINCNFASLINFTPGVAMLTGGTQQESAWGALLNFGDAATTYKIDSKTRHTADINAMVVGSQIPAANNSTGFEVTGVCDDVFVKWIEGELRGEDCVMINHTATSPTPIQYKNTVTEFFDINQTFMIYDPAAPTSQTLVCVGAVQMGEGATTTGSKIFDVISGTLVVDAEVLDAEMVVQVASGAIATMDVQAIGGESLADGGIIVYPSTSIITGNLNTLNGGSIQASAKNIFGNATTAGTGGMALVGISSFIGDITIGAGTTMFAIIDSHVGSLTVNGTLNGIINGVFYGNWITTGPFPFTDYENAIPNPAYQEGRVFYDMGRKALSYYNSESDTTINIAQETVVLVKNESGVALSNGQAVKAVGSSGGLPLVELALADVTDNAFVAGVITHDIPNNDTGFMTAFGSVGGLDTSTFSGGDVLYLSSTTPGLLTDEEQAVLSPVALVTTADMTDGTIFVRPRGVVNLTAVGQVFKDSGSPTQDITTAPEPVSAYENILAPGVNVSATFNASEGNFEAILAPAIIGATGYYSVDFGATCTYDDSKNVIFTVYINGSPSALGAIMPFSSVDPAEGASISINGLTPVVLSNTDDVEVYLQAESASGTITFQSCSFNINRVGNV